MKGLIMRVGVLCGLLANSLGLGCSAPLVPGSKPRVVVSYGSLELAPNADLSIVLDVRALLGLSVLDVSTSVSRIVAKVSGPHLAEPEVVSVDPDDCADGFATLDFISLPPGPVDIVVAAKDAEGETVSIAPGNAVIRPNETARVKLKWTRATGGLEIQFECPEPCATPGPTPSATSSPGFLAGKTYYEVSSYFRYPGVTWTGRRVPPNATTFEGLAAVAPFVDAQNHLMVPDHFEDQVWGTDFRTPDFQDWIQREFEGTRTITSFEIGDFTTAMNAQGWPPPDTYKHTLRISVWDADAGRWRQIDQLDNISLLSPYKKELEPPIRAKAFKIEVIGGNPYGFNMSRVKVLGH